MEGYTEDLIKTEELEKAIYQMNADRDSIGSYYYFVDFDTITTLK